MRPQQRIAQPPIRRSSEAQVKSESGPAWPKIDEAISNAVLKALRGDMEIQAAMDEAAGIVDGLLAE